MRAKVALSAVWVAVGCVGSARYPGTEVMGSFDFFAAPTASTWEGLPPCAYASPSEQPDGGFSFSGTFSRDQNNGETWFTVSGLSHPGNFDGQTMASVQTAPRRFDVECPPEDILVQETLAVALLSRTQTETVGGRCPPSPLDGGTPAPDGGVLPPGDRPGGGFDAILACGELVDVVLPDAGAGFPSCISCALVYSVTGTRR